MGHNFESAHILQIGNLKNDSFHSSGVSGSLHPIQETFSELNILVLHVHVVHVVGVRTHMKMVTNC